MARLYTWLIYSVTATALFNLKASHHALPQKDAHGITIAVPIGELIDKITILRIKAEKIQDEKKLANILQELALLTTAYAALKATPSIIQELMGKLQTINQQLWDVEDTLRRKEAEKCFDQEFIELARAVYYTNDERARIKRAINELCGSSLTEEKQYVQYGQMLSA